MRQLPFVTETSTQPAETRAEKARLRVLNGPTAVAGNSAQISRSLRALGFDSICLTYERNQYTSTDDAVIWDGSEGLLGRELKRFWTVMRYACTFDVYIFNYGTTISFPATNLDDSTVFRRACGTLHWIWTGALQYFELSILLLRRARVVVIFQGDDARQGDFQLATFDESIAHHVPPGYYTRRSDRRKRAVIKRLQTFGTRVLTLNPDLLPLLGSEAFFVPYCHINLDDWPSTEPPLGTKLIVGHFPSAPLVKGTRAVIDAVDNLADAGKSIELKLIHGVPQAEVRRLIQDCHVVVDQLYAGFYGGLAVEALALGRPVISYLRLPDFQDLNPSYFQELPVISATAETLPSVLQAFSNFNQDELAALANKGRTFVERWHDPSAISLALFRHTKALRFRPHSVLGLTRRARYFRAPK